MEIKIRLENQFKRTDLATSPDILSFSMNSENIPLEVLEESILGLSKYILTGGDISVFEFSPHYRNVFAPLEREQMDQQRKDLQNLKFTGKITKELSLIAFQWVRLSAYFRTRNSNYALMDSPNKETLYNMTHFSYRVINYLRNYLGSEIWNFEFFNEVSLEDKSFVIAGENLIFLKFEESNQLNPEDAKKIYEIYKTKIKKANLSFHKIKKLSIFNVRMNKEYSLDLTKNNLEDF